MFMPSPAAAAPASSAFLTMAELPEGHSSWQVVELIFSSGWGHPAASSATAAAPEVEDGNEMMRFQCRPAAGSGGGVFGAGVATCQLGPSVSAVRTFACSGTAHARAVSSSPAAGRRAMLVCRVIAGRVRTARRDDQLARRCHAPRTTTLWT
jgi:hypothetical protein